MTKAKLYREFWEDFFALPESKIQIYSKAKPTDRGSVCLGYENGISFWSKLKGKKSHTAVYISQPEESENKRIFNELKRRQNEIHNSFGASLVWEELAGKLPCSNLL